MSTVSGASICPAAIDDRGAMVNGSIAYQPWRKSLNRSGSIAPDKRTSDDAAVAQNEYL